MKLNVARWYASHVGRTGVAEQRSRRRMLAALERERTVAEANRRRVETVAERFTEELPTRISQSEAQRLMEIDCALRTELLDAQSLVHRIERAIRWNTASMASLADEHIQEMIDLARWDQELEQLQEP